MKEVKTEILINAKPELVWGILIDFPSYTVWNPFIRSIQGEPMVGSKIEIEIQTPKGKKRHYAPKITVLKKFEELRWNGKIPGFLGGEHIFEIKQQTGQTTEFVQREIFSGLLVSAFGKSTDNDIRGGFDMMNKALKDRAEDSIHSSGS